jgi:hypothetical protein
MSKSVLVIDTPETCLDCIFCHEFDEGKEAYCYVTDGDKGSEFMKRIECEDGYCQGKPDWCPLKPLPEKMTGVVLIEHWSGVKKGWNGCIDAIAGENKGK